MVTRQPRSGSPPPFSYAAVVPRWKLLYFNTLNPKRRRALQPRVEPSEIVTCRVSGSPMTDDRCTSMHVGRAARGEIVEHFANAVIFARLVEEIVGAKRHALRPVLRKRLVGEHDHLYVRWPARDQCAQHA